MKRVVTILCLAAFCMVFAGAAMAQISATGAMTGNVLDPDGKAVVGATVTITNTATGASQEPIKTGSSGEFSAGNLPPGIYTVEISMANFKTAKIENIEIIVGKTYNISQKLELGVSTASVTIEGGQQVLETSNTSVENVISGRRVTDLPFASRSAVLLGMLDPGAQTLAGPRNTTFEGLPKGAINITFDGINNQDNLLKSSDGFFALQDARIDDVQEFGITTNANDASKSGEGAVQMNYVSKSGGNSFHGGVWEYNRNTDFDANYYFNNLAGTPRAILKLNEFGYKVGGPIWKDKLFFFTDFEFFQFPQSVSRTKTILNAAAAGGVYTYTTGSAYTVPVGGPSAGTGGPCGGVAGTVVPVGTTCTLNVLTLAGANALPNTINGTVATFLGYTQAARTASGVSATLNATLFQDTLSYNAATIGTRRYPDLRLDYNLTKHMTIEFDYHYSHFASTPDVLNSVDPTYPVAPLNTNRGTQLSNRNLWVGAWRWNIGSNKTNELRFGISAAPTNFGAGMNFSYYPSANATTNVGPTPTFQYTFGLFGTSSPFLSQGSQQGRNSAFGQLHDGYSWTKGTHQFSFGYDQTSFRYNDFFRVNPSFGLGLATGDPAIAAFTNTGSSPTMPGASSTNLGSAEGLYGTLTGRVSSFSSAEYYNPAIGAYQAGATELDRFYLSELGFYGTDSWRVRPTLTFNYGLRWEYQGLPSDQYHEYYLPLGGLNDVWGISGMGNIYRPGTLTGAPCNPLGSVALTPVAGGVTGTTSGVSTCGEFWSLDNQGLTPQFKNKYYRALAPSVGFAWQPNSDNSLFRHVFGGAGKTVLRAGYAISYSREGLNEYFGVWEDNPGYSAGLSASPGAVTNAAIGNYAFGQQLATSGTTSLPGVLQNPSSFASQFVNNPAAGNDVTMAAPNLKPPMVESWQVGVQRELSPSMVLEIRYQGNHGVGLWNLFGSFNETNIFENSFINEFSNAVSNLNICNSNPLPCVHAEQDMGILTQGSTATTPTQDFANLFAAATAACAVGSPPASCSNSIATLSGQANLPIFTAAFNVNANCTATSICTSTNATTLASQLASSFRSSTFLSPMVIGGVGSIASTMASYTSAGQYLKGMMAAGYPANFFRVNPYAVPFVLANANQSTYNALIVDFRKRPSKGLQFDLSYAFAKSLTDYQATGSSISNGGFTTMRDLPYNKGPAPFDIRHAIKLQTLYELPFGEGRKWSSSSGIVNRIIGGWQFNGVTRWQTGTPVQITSGLSGGNTFNGSDPGVNLVGLTTGQLQSQLQINKSEGPAGTFVYYVPASLLGSVGALQGANTSVIQPCAVAGTLCSRIFMYGPQFFEADWNIAKITKITEHVNFEMRMEALNVFNNQNFYWACGVATDPSACSISTQSSGFGRMGGGTNSVAAYTDLNTTQFPGGRVIQLVGRINF